MTQLAQSLRDKTAVCGVGLLIGSYPEEKPFWEAAKQRRLVLRRRKRCTKAWYPIGPTCPHCFSMDFERL